METSTRQLADRYLSALRTHLAQGPEANLAAASTLGRQAKRAGLGALELAQIHEQALIALLYPDHPPGGGDGTIVEAGGFFRRALTPLVSASPGRSPTATRSPRLAQVSALQLRLQKETNRRIAAEIALKESRRNLRDELAQSHLMQAQVRQLSHQVLFAQEEERKHISRELHDEISQILTGINVRLATLKIEASTRTGNLKTKITHTQRLVERSVEAVHRFARELRPAMLDDLGLIPALLTFMKEFGRRTGVRVRFTSATASRIENLDSLKRTVLYRVTQEALTNIGKHAQASEAKVSILLPSGSVVLEIADDGKAFSVDEVFGAKRFRRLGIIGMRERVEMVGGTFAIESVVGTGTQIHVRIPLGKRARANRKLEQPTLPTLPTLIPSPPSESP